MFHGRLTENLTRRGHRSRAFITKKKLFSKTAAKHPWGEYVRVEKDANRLSLLIAACICRFFNSLLLWWE